MTEFSSITYEVDEAVCVITMDRPEVANAQNTELLDEIDAAFDLADADDDVRVVILAGNGKHWSAGHDLKALVGDVEPDQWRLMRDTPEGKWHHEKVMYFDRCLRIRDFRKHNHRRGARQVHRRGRDTCLYVRLDRGQRRCLVSESCPANDRSRS